MSNKQLTRRSALVALAGHAFSISVIVAITLLPILVHPVSPSCGGFRAMLGLEQPFFHETWWTFTILDYRLDFRGLRMWDIAAILQAVLSTAVLWYEAEANKVIKPLGVIGFLVLVSAVTAAIAIGRGYETLYHSTVLVLVVLFTAGDVLTYFNRRHKLFWQLAVTVDVPIILSYFLVMFYLDVGERGLRPSIREALISGAVAFQLILGSFAILAMRIWWGAESDALPFRQRFRDYKAALLNKTISAGG